MAGGFVHDTDKYLKMLRRKNEDFYTFVKVKKRKKGRTEKKLYIGIQRIKKGGGYEDEPTHKNAEVYYVLKGHALLSIRNKVLKVSPGMAIYVPAGYRHRFYSAKDEFAFLFIFAGEDV
jgi:mannose-6-phosphate isomerase-like protein (cupin superfamily)